MLDATRLAEMADQLVTVPGVRAVALGGSRATGTHHETSDVDLGVYHDASLDLAALQRLAEQWSRRPVQVAGPGGWGPWVHGGGWLLVDDTPVDWILRDEASVREQCRRACRGDFAFHAQPGHPLGFLDVSYAGEVACCRPLADPHQLLAGMKQALTPYPAALREAILANQWQADFLLDAAAKGARRGDVAYVTLCCATATMLVAHGWHAAAGRWVLNEKGLVPGVARLELDTGDFAARAGAALSTLGGGPDQLAAGVGALRDVLSRRA